MRPARHAVVRFVPDPARNEELNIGIVVWDETSCRVRVDPDAVARVIKENPHLSRDALGYVEPSLRQTFLAYGRSNPDLIVDWIEHQRGFPLLLTEPRQTTVKDGQGLDETLDRLIEYVVHPSRRAGGGVRPAQVIAKQLRPLLRRDLIHQNYAFACRRSKSQRVVDFYANSQTNTALDTLSLALKKADDIRLRADAEAFKIEDIQENHRMVRFVVYCRFSKDQHLTTVSESARATLQSVGAEVVTDIESAVQAVAPSYI